MTAARQLQRLQASSACTEEARMKSPAPTQITNTWPALPQSEWSDTCATLLLWMQVVGKVRLALTPHINHAWNVTLYPTVRGVTTSPMFCGGRTLQIDFDFLDHALRIEADTGEERTIFLQPMSVAVFYRRVLEALEKIRTPVQIWPRPCEIADPIPFEKDEEHC